MINLIAIINNIWGNSPSPQVKNRLAPSPCDLEKKNHLMKTGSYYWQKVSAKLIAMKTWLFMILRLPNSGFVNQPYSYFLFLFYKLKNQNFTIYKLHYLLCNAIKGMGRFVLCGWERHIGLEIVL